MKLVVSLENRLPEVQAALQAVLTSGMYAEGSFSTKAESMLEKEVGTPSAVVNSCGSALYLTYRWLVDQGVRKLYVQNNTFYATASTALEAGLEVVLVDSSEDCPSMGYEALKETAAGETEKFAVCLTHVAGWLAKDYDKIAEYCDALGLFLVEDCAHALGVNRAGTLGDVACWSFYPTKAVPAGEGGAVSTRVPELLAYVKSFRQYGKSVVDGVVTYATGMNLRMSEFDAAVLTVQLEHLPDILAHRRRDASVLQSIAKCLLTGESNYYKFPVAPVDADGLKCVSGIYAKTDQLLTSLAAYGGKVTAPTSLKHSEEWATNHKCLFIGEGLYNDMTREEVLAALQA